MGNYVAPAGNWLRLSFFPFPQASLSRSIPPSPMLVTCHWCGEAWEVGQSHHCPNQAMADAMLKPKPGSEATKFLVWWKDDKERRLCTLEQAIGAYISTFPGRLHSLLVELLEPLR